MRLKTLFKYNVSTIKVAVLIFTSCYMLGMLISSVASTLSGNVVMGSSIETESGIVTFSTSIVAFAIFMLVSSLIGSQQDTRFLITRSVSRKEIYISNVLFVFPLAAFMTVLQIGTIYLDSFVRWLLSKEWRGLGVDIQAYQAPNMDNIFVFFAVAFSILLTFGSLSYLLGSLLARWKAPVIGALIVSGIVFVTCLAVPSSYRVIADALKFMFIDENNGLWIALKQIVLSVAVLLAAFPVMRRITAAKQ